MRNAIKFFKQPVINTLKMTGYSVASVTVGNVVCELGALIGENVKQVVKKYTPETDQHADHMVIAPKKS